ncbi:MAG: hypothetical protein GC192_21650 [Bacteroidetes bacterium]|nr:hypothetical protein [Bacteroidota bacterium]
MKKVIFENCSRAFLATFCFLILGVIGVSAQSKLTEVPLVPGVSNPPSSSSPLYNAPSGNFVSGSVALDKLEAAMVAIKSDMMAAQNDPATFDALLVKYKYYSSVSHHITTGATVPNAISAGLWIFLESAELGSVSQSVRTALKAEVVALLQS